MIHFNILASAKMERKKEKTHIYFMPADNYFIRIMSEIITLALHHNASEKVKHIIIPIYGQRFNESLDSKFPKLLKKAHVRLIYWRSQFSLNQKLKAELASYFSIQELQSISFVPPIYFLITSVLDHCSSLLKSMMPIKGHNKTIISDYDLTDQVIDTYLRFKPSEMYDCNDYFLKHNLFYSFLLHPNILKTQHMPL